ncbi:hypothetical protein Q5424_18530 [Conexibacter sp. JD483]|uniref:hypothetical protein n=1 Tax=unclassified Conexibacter TaxID=2627773 RepID=UPI00271D6F04|nr:MULTISPECIES: hypothetical protein [unclassified Conexibacter]MDO8185478.1 hypothetical protein [Conexibacter sp. CPCC 205706]MDO8197335.1 hypothetical protein [Conexibacter sp. CPCC 205762]MDR9371099.1 hypothetical protein [Conexibacter sp. JD483]
MSGGSREFEVKGHSVRVTGGDEPLRPFRGFFSGDPLPAGHVHAETPAPTAREAAPADAEEALAADPSLVRIEIDDDYSFDLHRTPEGDLHAHSLPFQAFASVEDAVAELVRIVDRGSRG